MTITKATRHSQEGIKRNSSHPPEAVVKLPGVSDLVFERPRSAKGTQYIHQIGSRASKILRAWKCYQKSILVIGNTYPRIYIAGRSYLLKLRRSVALVFGDSEDQAVRNLLAKLDPYLLLPPLYPGRRGFFSAGCKIFQQISIYLGDVETNYVPGKSTGGSHLRSSLLPHYRILHNSLGH